jgi:hypothetical protein
MIIALENGVMIIPLMLEIHSCGKTGGTASDNTDFCVLIHKYPPDQKNGLFDFIIGRNQKQCIRFFSRLSRGLTKYQKSSFSSESGLFIPILPVDAVLTAFL